MSQDNTAGMLTVEEALAKDDLTPEVRKMLEKAHKQEVLVRRNKKEDFVRLTPPNKEAQRYTETEKQKLYEAGEKGDFLLFLKVLTNPNKKVMRLIYPENKIVKMLSSIPSTLDEFTAGTFLFSRTEMSWKLSLLLIKNKKPELKEINISQINDLEDALSQLPKDKMPEQYTESDIKNIARLIPLYPIDSYEDISGETDFFQCLTSAQITYLMANAPHRVPILPENFPASINDVWASSVEVDIFLGKIKREEETLKPATEKKTDRRKSDIADALRCLTKFVWNNGKGKDWKAFIDMLDTDHTKENPYEGYGDCTKIYQKGEKICFTLESDQGAKFVTRSKFSLKCYFKQAKN